MSEFSHRHLQFHGAGFARLAKQERESVCVCACEREREKGQGKRLHSASYHIDSKKGAAVITLPKIEVLQNEISYCTDSRTPAEDGPGQQFGVQDNPAKRPFYLGVL